MARSASGSLTVSFGPVSTTSTTSTFAPVPRFVGVGAPVDCTVLGDCSTYVPRMDAPPVNMDFRLIRGVGNQLRDIALSNVGGGRLMPWSATIEYKQGSDWIVLDRMSASEPVLVRVMVRALPNMAPGIYEATLTIDAGIAGVARYPIRLEVIEAPPPAENPNRPRVSSVVHGATFQSGPVARGSLVTLRGVNLGGEGVSVTFDGKPASILYTASGQINVRVPEDLAGNTAQVVVTANGVASTPVSVEVAGANPGIFTPGILNQDGSVNSEANPAPTGSHVQIFATGLLAPDGSGVVEATLHGYAFARQPYAGPAPGLPGVQQVNLPIPEGWPTMTTTVLLCTSAGGSRQCSAPVYIHMRRADAGE